MLEVTLLREEKFMQNKHILKANANSVRVKIKDIWRQFYCPIIFKSTRRRFKVKIGCKNINLKKDDKYEKKN